MLIAPEEHDCFGTFTGKMRDELFKQRNYHAVKEAEMQIEHWPVEYNNIRLHRRGGGDKPWLLMQRLNSHTSHSDEYCEWCTNRGSVF